MTDALSQHYAEALADAVFQPNAGISPDEARTQLAAATGVITGSEELQRVLLSPAVPRGKKTELVGKILEEYGLNRLIRNFLMVIVEHRRIAELGRIKDSFELAVDEREGWLRAEIVTATELTDSQQQEILHSLTSLAGKRIRPVYKLDRSILGGVIARFGSREYDGSVIGRLEAMRRRLSPAS